MTLKVYTYIALIDGKYLGKCTSVSVHKAEIEAELKECPEKIFGKKVEYLLLEFDTQSVLVKEQSNEPR